MIDEFNNNLVRAFYAECTRTGKMYALRNLSLVLQLGLTSSCNFSVICEVDRSRILKSADQALLTGFGPSDVTKFETLRGVNSIEELTKAFAYREHIKIHQVLNNKLQLVFNGYVLNTTNSLSFSNGDIQSRIDVKAASAAGIYDNEFPIGQYMFTREATALPISTSAAVNLRSRDNRDLLNAQGSDNFPIVDFTMKLLDAATEGMTKGTWPSAEQSAITTITTLNSFIAADTAPKMALSDKDMKLQLGKAIQTSGANALSNSSPLVVMNNIIQGFFMTFVPLVQEGDICLRVIPNIGIRTYKEQKTQPELHPSDIINFVSYPAQKRIGAYSGVVVTANINAVANPGDKKTGVRIGYGMLYGYTADGKPTKKEMKINEILDTVGKYNKEGKKTAHLIQPFGAYTLVRLPQWVVAFNDKASEDKTKDSKTTNEKPKSYASKQLEAAEKFARAMTMMVLGSGGGFSGRVATTVSPALYESVKNKIGEVFKLNLSNSLTGASLIRYGRLVAINYVMETSSNALNITLGLTFDCVVTEDEYKEFSITPEDAGFVK